jgi:protoporphyrin/coproporphyrin ferrochelatase
VKRAVLLMAYGGPATLSEVEPFLLDVRGGRETPEHLVEEVKARYREIGGGSPILALTRDQARALEAELNSLKRGDGAGEWRVFVGMRHWHPYIRDVVEGIAGGGFDELVALCLTPQESRMSVGAYFRALEQALEEVGCGAEVVPIRSWHDHAGFLDAVAAKVVDAMRRMARFDADERSDLQVVFTAHSLPESILREGDPYDDQVRETARLVTGRVEERTGEPLAWHVAYQSAGARAVPWLGPSLDETLVRLGREGHGRVLVAPVGFVSDHVEILFDLDVEAKARAAGLRMRLERTESLNDSPEFIGALADVVRAATTSPVSS